MRRAPALAPEPAGIHAVPASARVGFLLADRVSAIGFLP